MIKISKLADYGIVLLSCMAQQPKTESYTARELSSGSGLPLPMVSKVLKLLTRENILVSHRGVKGGYSLSRDPESINAAEIIGALDGPIALTSCLDEGHINCCIESNCAVRDYWGLINDKIIDSLQSVSLAEMCLQPTLTKKVEKTAASTHSPATG